MSSHWKHPPLFSAANAKWKQTIFLCFFLRMRNLKHIVLKVWLIDQGLREAFEKKFLANIDFFENNCWLFQLEYETFLKKIWDVTINLLIAPKLSSRVYIAVYLLLCRLNGSTYVRCPAGKFLYNNKSTAQVNCIDGKFTPAVKYPESLANLECLEGCPVPCQNRGTCIGMNICNCTQHFEGTNCQMKKCNQAVVVANSELQVM